MVYPQGQHLFHLPLVRLPFCSSASAAHEITLRRAIADTSPRNAILTQLFTSLIEESLTKFSYDATLAGLHYAFGTESGGFSLIVSGYTEKLPLLASVVLDTAKDFQIADKDFEIVHDRLTRAYANAKLSNPSGLADAEIRRLTRQTYWTWDERLEALQGPSRSGLTPACSLLILFLAGVTLADVRQHAQQLLAKYSLDALITGNFAATVRSSARDRGQRLSIYFAGCRQDG